MGQFGYYGSRSNTDSIDFSSAPGLTKKAYILIDINHQTYANSEI